MERNDLPREVHYHESSSSRMPEINNEVSLMPKENKSGQSMDKRVIKDNPAINPLLSENRISPEINKVKDPMEERVYNETREFDKLNARSYGSYEAPSEQKIADSARILFPSMNTDQAPEQVIKVNIGQITIKAVNQPAQLSVQRPANAHKPVLTLEDYLKQRSKR